MRSAFFAVLVLVAFAATLGFSYGKLVARFFALVNVFSN